MNYFDILLLAVALAMDCFTVSIVSGLLLTPPGQPTAHGNGDRQTPLRMAALFGLFQALMPLAGWLATNRLSSALETAGHWVAFCLLAFIGGRMAVDGLRGQEERLFDPRRLRTQLVLAVATSIDALAVGVSMACTGYTHAAQLTLPLTVIGLVSVLFSLAGYAIGRRGRHGVARRMKPGLLGGLILIGIGLKILLTHHSF